MLGSVRYLPLLNAIALAALVGASGCTRHDFRERADKDVEGVITQKNVFTDWQLKNWNAYPDPRARYADNTNPDRPPYPPDDYAARLLSPNPQRPGKKSGVGRVDGTGYVAFLETWDVKNRSEAANSAVRGAALENAPPAEAQATSTQPLPPPVAVIASDRPAVKHALPSSFPAALRPGTSAPKTEPQPQPPAQAVVQAGPVLPAAPPVPPAVPAPIAPVGDTAPLVKPMVPDEFAPWGPPKPHMLGPVASDRGNAPAITEPKRPIVLVGAGEVEEKGRPVPAIAVTPLDAQPGVPPPVAKELLTQPPTPVGKQPNPLTTPPLPKDPLPGNALGPGLGAPVAVSDDPVNDYLRALESKQVGYLLKMDQAVELAVLTAREIQDRREDVYLAALPVTLERFNFAAQAFWMETITRQSIGGSLAGAGQMWNLNTTPGVSKLFPTGATLMAQIANQVVLDMGNGKPTVAISNLTLNLAQPLLQGGGFAVNLENLTQAERTMVYAMRSYARFRKLFYIAIASGSGGYTNNPYGLEGLSVNLGRGIGENLTAPTPGYLPLLYQLAVINNQRKNVTALERLLKLYQAFREGGQQSDLQVGQVEVQLLNSRFGLLGAPVSTNNSSTGIRGYLDTLDNFKLQLGLPLTTGLELDDTPIQPIRQQLARLEQVYAQVQAVEVTAAKYDQNEPVADFRKRWLTLFTTSPLVQGTPFAQRIAQRWASWAPDKLNGDQLRARLDGLRDERKKLLDARTERELKKLPEPPAEIARLDALNAELDLGVFEQRVRDYESQPWARKTGKERDSIQNTAFSAAYNSFYQVILEGRNDRLAALYQSWPKLAGLPVVGVNVLESSLDEAYTAVIQAALTSRLDLMNARSDVVDGWRQIAVAANALQGVFTVSYNLNSGTPANSAQPFSFSSSRSTSQLVFNMQLPLVRRAERNNYRATLINYQRTRRTLMAFEDNIANDVRGDVRELRTLAQLYRIQQRVLELQYAQVDNATAILFAPPVPGGGFDAGTAAALTTQVLNAQANLLAAQNTLYQLWVAYLTSRMTFYVDLELMKLDDRGVWIDESSNRTDSQSRPNNNPPGERVPAPQPLGNGPGAGPGR